MLEKDKLPDNANTRAGALSRVHLLRVTSGAEALSLILSSERVFVDLRDWLEFGEPEQVALRRWEPRLRYDYEFRLFVRHGKVTAISQYDHYAVYPHLHAMRDTIQKALLDFWAQIHTHVGETSYIMDLGYLQDNGTVVLVELSPFLRCTGPAMFRWEKDSEVLENGPMEFRLRSTEYPGLQQLVDCWEDRWRTKHEPYYEFYQRAREATPEDSRAYTSSHIGPNSPPITSCHVKGKAPTPSPKSDGLNSVKYFIPVGLGALVILFGVLSGHTTVSILSVAVFAIMLIMVFYLSLIHI